MPLRIIESNKGGKVLVDETSRTYGLLLTKKTNPPHIWHCNYQDHLMYWRHKLYIKSNKSRDEKEKLQMFTSMNRFHEQIGELCFVRNAIVNWFKIKSVSNSAVVNEALNCVKADYIDLVLLPEFFISLFLLRLHPDFDKHDEIYFKKCYADVDNFLNKDLLYVSF